MSLINFKFNVQCKRKIKIVKNNIFFSLDKKKWWKAYKIFELKVLDRYVRKILILNLILLLLFTNNIY